jgi:2',3'-cyclic-nucleotide 2'-phosphodiesterase (5'-nucleotidase family)
MKQFLPLLIFGSMVISLAACSGTKGAPTVAPQIYNISEKTEEGLPSTTEVEDMDALIAPYKAQLDAKMNRQLAVIKTPLVKASPEGNLGNWMADIMQQAAEDIYPDLDIAFAATNSGGLRVQEIGTGPLIVSELYELMPFDNKLVVLKLKGKVVKEFLAHIANSGGWPVSAELSVDQTTGPLIVTISGQQINPDQDYYVATIDYVANGGSNSTMLKGIPQMDSGRFLRDILIEYAEKTPEIDVRAEGKRMRL